MPVTCSICEESCSLSCYESHRHKYACHNNYCSLYKPRDFDLVDGKIYHTGEHGYPGSTSRHRTSPPHRESYSGRPRQYRDDDRTRSRRDSYVDPTDSRPNPYSRSRRDSYVDPTAPRPSRWSSYHDSDPHKSHKPRREPGSSLPDEFVNFFAGMGFEDADLPPRRSRRRDSTYGGYDPFDSSSSSRWSGRNEHRSCRSERPQSHQPRDYTSSSGRAREDGYSYSPRGSRYEDGEYPSSSYRHGTARPSARRGAEEIDEATGLPICKEYIYHSTEEPEGEVIDKGPAWGMSTEEAYEYAWGRSGDRC